MVAIADQPATGFASVATRGKKCDAAIALGHRRTSLILKRVADAYTKDAGPGDGPTSDAAVRILRDTSVALPTSDADH